MTEKLDGELTELKNRYDVKRANLKNERAALKALAGDLAESTGEKWKKTEATHAEKNNLIEALEVEIKELGRLIRIKSAEIGRRDMEKNRLEVVDVNAEELKLRNECLEARRLLASEINNIHHGHGSNEEANKLSARVEELHNKWLASIEKLRFLAAQANGISLMSLRAK